MYWIKACTKCGGDLYESADQHGRYVACLQCGRYSTEGKLARLETLPPKGAMGNPASIEQEALAA